MMFTGSSCLRTVFSVTGKRSQGHGCSPSCADLTVSTAAPATGDSESTHAFPSTDGDSCPVELTSSSQLHSVVATKIPTSKITTSVHRATTFLISPIPSAGEEDGEE